jgi:hypothetical protein
LQIKSDFIIEFFAQAIEDFLETFANWRFKNANFK